MKKWQPTKSFTKKIAKLLKLDPGPNVYKLGKFETSGIIPGGHNYIWKVAKDFIPYGYEKVFISFKISNLDLKWSLTVYAEIPNIRLKVISGNLVEIKDGTVDDILFESSGKISF